MNIDRLSIEAKILTSTEKSETDKKTNRQTVKTDDRLSNI